MSVENFKTDETTVITFLDQLRTKTAIAHKKLEAIPISKTIINPEITRDEYALYLNLMHDVVHNLESEIYPILGEVISDLKERKKAHFLLNDLKSIRSENKQVVFPFKNTSELSVPFAMGMMYVVEGSTLGGRYILKNIQENLNYSEENGASYFSGYGNKTGSSWKKFLSELTDFEEKTNSGDEIIQGADYAFQIIGEHLYKNSI